MSYGTQNDRLAYTLAPHQLHNEVYSASSSCSGYILPPAIPLENDSVISPSVDCQSAQDWATPRTRVGIGGSMGIYSGYRDFADASRPAIPASLPIGPSVTPVQYNYFGCR